MSMFLVKTIRRTTLSSVFTLSLLGMHVHTYGVEEIFGTNVERTLEPTDTLKVWLDEYYHRSYLLIKESGFSPYNRVNVASITKIDATSLAGANAATVLFNHNTTDTNLGYSQDGIVIEQTSDGFGPVTVTITREDTHKASLGHDEQPENIIKMENLPVPYELLRDGQTGDTKVPIAMKTQSIGTFADGVDVAIVDFIPSGISRTAPEAFIGLATSIENAKAGIFIAETKASYETREGFKQEADGVYKGIGWVRAKFPNAVNVENYSDLYVVVNFVNLYVPEAVGPTDGEFYLMEEGRQSTSLGFALDKDVGIRLLMSGVGVHARDQEEAEENKGAEAGSLSSLWLSFIALFMFRRRRL